jgi:hypothetical protein
MAEQNKCPVCDDILTEVEDGLFCESCEYKEPADENENAEPEQSIDTKGTGDTEKESKGAEQPEQENAAPSEAISGSGRTEGGPVNPGRDFINPGMRKLPSVTVYGWRIGHARVRYGLSKPPHYIAIYEKRMSGREAFHFLTNVKRQNKHRRVETKVVLAVD